MPYIQMSRVKDYEYFEPQSLVAVTQHASLADRLTDTGALAHVPGES